MTTGERFHILHLTDGNRGGSQRHIVDLCSPSTAEARHFILRVGDDVVALTDTDGCRLLALERHRIAGGWPVFFEHVRLELGIGFVHAHALDPLLELAAHAGGATLASSPYAVTLHDVRAIDPDALASGRAIVTPQPHWNARCEPVLRHAARVIVPSGWLREAVRGVYRDLDPVVIPNGLAPPHRARVRTEASLATSARRYVVVGALGAHKGSATLLAVAGSIAEPGIVGIVVGYTEERDTAGWALPDRLYVHGRYDAHELPSLLAAYRPDLAYFPNIVPESFSYALSECWQAGIPALVPDVGALGTRMREAGAGWLLDDPLDAARAARRIEQLLGPGGAHEVEAAQARAREISSSVPDVATMRERVAAVYRDAARLSSEDVEAGWIALGLAAHDARLPGTDGSLFDAQWPIVAREEQSLRRWSDKLGADIATIEADAEYSVVRGVKLDAAVRDLRARNADIEREAATLSAKNTELESEIVRASALDRERERALAEIRDRNAALEQHVVALRERNARVEADVVALVARNLQVEGDAAALGGHNARLEADIVALKERNTLLEAALLDIGARNARIESGALPLGRLARFVRFDGSREAWRLRLKRIDRLLHGVPSQLFNRFRGHAR